MHFYAFWAAFNIKKTLLRHTTHFILESSELREEDNISEVNNQWNVILLRTYISCKVWHLILQKTMPVQSLPGRLVHLCRHIFGWHSRFSPLHLFKQLGASLQGQLVQWHMVITHPQQLRQLVLPGFDTLLGATKHDVHWHPPRAQPLSLLNSLQSLVRTVVSSKDFQVIVLQRLMDWKCGLLHGTSSIICDKSSINYTHLDPNGETVNPSMAEIL